MSLTNPRRILITGPESSGKSTLVKALAETHDCPWVPEYARAYLHDLNHPYTEQDILHIAVGQRRAEEMATSPPGHWLFCDTSTLVLRIWLREKLGHTAPSLETAWQLHPYAGIILCTPDIPWEPDPLRENPDDRERLFEIYQHELAKVNCPVLVVRGALAERLERVSHFLHALQAR